MAATAALLVLAGWLLGANGQPSEEHILQALIDNPVAAHPLEKSDLALEASGMLYADPTGSDAFLIARGLPVLPPNQRYQVWLLTSDNGPRVSVGLFTVTPDGVGEIWLQIPQPISAYEAVAITVEPAAGSTTPTTLQSLGDWISG